VGEEIEVVKVKELWKRLKLFASSRMSSLFPLNDVVKARFSSVKAVSHFQSFFYLNITNRRHCSQTKTIETNHNRIDLFSLINHTAEDRDFYKSVEETAEKLIAMIKNE
jgi:hypothetical protein